MLRYCVDMCCAYFRLDLYLNKLSLAAISNTGFPTDGENRRGRVRQRLDRRPHTCYREQVSDSATPSYVFDYLSLTVFPVFLVGRPHFFASWYWVGAWAPCGSPLPRLTVRMVLVLRELLTESLVERCMCEDGILVIFFKIKKLINTPKYYLL